MASANCRGNSVDEFVAIRVCCVLPPRESLKAVTTAIAALGVLGVDRPGERLAMIRSWDLAVLVVKNGRLNDA